MDFLSMAGMQRWCSQPAPPAAPPASPSAAPAALHGRSAKLAQLAALRQLQATSPPADKASVRAPTVNVPVPHRLIVGGLAGSTGMAIVFPIDTVKAKLQNNKTPISIINMARQMYAAQGLPAFYRGWASGVIGVFPEKAVKLAVNDFVVNRLPVDKHGLLPLQYGLVAGGIAGVVTSLVTNPIEVVRINMQLQTGKAGTLETIREINANGIGKGVYRHFSATLLRDIPYNAFFFPFYAGLRRNVVGDHDAGLKNLHKVLFCGATAGMAAGWLCTPMDVVKTRLQAQNSPYKNVPQCAREVYAKEGYRAFFKGATNRVAVQAPLYSITLLAFELLKQYLANNPSDF